MDGNGLILIVDNEKGMTKILLEDLSRDGFLIYLAEKEEKALQLLERKSFDLVILSRDLPDGDGLALLKKIKLKVLHTPIIMTGFGSIQDAVEAIKGGAVDYLSKPISLEILHEKIRMILRPDPSRQKINFEKDLSNPSIPILTCNDRMKEAIHLCERIAQSKVPVLIQGESGTGKELFARFIHDLSPRKDGPFVAVNCASLPETLFESELFGYEKGAFTGALNRKIGKFEMAQKGSLLLDEVSEMSPFLQAKILRVLQENEVDRIGGRDPIPIDVRVIATTNRNIETCIEKGEFREDLYYRLNVITIKLPPLRERVEDIELLTKWFLKRYSSFYQKTDLSITEDALNWLKRQPWRGNVRELKNMLERTVLIASKNTVDLDDLCPEKLDERNEMEGDETSCLSLREMERRLIFKALEKTNGNRTYAAKALGISIRTLRNKLHEYKQNFPSWGSL